MEIAPATTDDIDAVTELWIALAADQRAHGSHLLARKNRGVVRATVARRTVVDELLVARTDDGAVVGFAMGTVGPTRYEQDVVRGLVENLYVDPRFRNDGVGDDLLGTLEDRLTDAGAEVLALEAMAANETARRFYGRRGYAPHRIELEKPVPEDAERASNADHDGDIDPEDTDPDDI